MEQRRCHQKRIAINRTRTQHCSILRFVDLTITLILHAPSKLPTSSHSSLPTIPPYRVLDAAMLDLLQTTYKSAQATVFGSWWRT
ncbi:unnamed protein product [Colias eurytheme]|nr:unnamed protein product [Colias eurytheme]